MAALVLGLDDADRLAVQKASAFVDLRWVDAPRLRALIAGLWSDSERDLASALPEPTAQLEALIAWCAQTLEDRGAWSFGLVLGAIREAYAYAGWAVTAATIAAGDAAADLPAWDELVAHTSRVASARFADAACASLGALEPIGDRLDAIGWPAPGLDLATAAFARIAAVAPGDLRAVPARARLVHAFATVNAMLASAPMPYAPADDAADLRAHAGWLAVEQASAWTWASVDAWRTGDPLAPGKAIARVAGMPIASTLDEIRIAIANQLDELAPLAWRRAIASARAELADPPASRLIDAILAIADAASAHAARELAGAIRDRRDPRPILDALLGDPRACRAAWEPSATSVRAAVSDG